MILDYYDDDGAYLSEVFQDEEIPEVIKQASCASKSRSKYAEDFGTQVGTAFKYPIYDKGNTLKSAIYFAKFGHSLDPPNRIEAAQKIAAALQDYGLVVPEELSKTASMELGLSWESEETKLENLFGSLDDVEVLRSEFDRCTPRGKRRLAFQLKEASALDPRLANYKGSEVGSDLDLAISSRKLCVPTDEQRDKLSAIFEKSASVDPDITVRRLEGFDRVNHIYHLYGKYFPDPVASVYGRTLEKAASTEYVEIGDERVEPSDFQSFVESSYDNLEQSFGSEFADQLKSDPVSVYNSLPVTHKRAIGNMYSEGR